MSSSSADNARVRPEVPRINVENLGGNDQEQHHHQDVISASSATQSPVAGRERNLSVSMNTTRDRSMSGSTMHSAAPLSPMLSVPPSRGEGSSSASTMTVNWDPEEALRPDPGTENDFVVENNVFAFSPGQLSKLLNPKSLPAFAALGGLAGIARGLRTDLKAGLSVDETSLDGKISFDEAVQGSVAGPSGDAGRPPSSDAFADRIRVYNINQLPVKKATPLYKLIWQAYNDKILILLTIAAAISLALGLYESLGVEHPPGSPPAIDWVEGLAICIAIIIVVLVGAVNDYQKERAFVRLNTKKEDREVKVIRSGKSVMLNVHEILAGDVIHLEPGDIIPADGIFISGHNLKCDESSATGESDQLKKTPGDEVMKQINLGYTNTKDLDPFIISGSKVLEGVGTFVVTSVGVNSSFGKILMAMRQDMETTPLQVKLNGLAGAIAKLGSSAAILLFLILTFRFIGTLSTNPRSPAEKGSEFIDILIIAVTVIVVAVPEGLPLAVTLALAFATTRLLKQNNLVRVLKSCETMGNATTVCSDKTGTLTTNKMTVVTGTFGDLEFDDKNQTGNEQRSTAFGQALDQENKKILLDSIALNSTAFEEDGEGEASFVGSKTETALLSFARKYLGMGRVAEERSNANIIQIMPFDSGRKCMGAVERLQNGTCRLLVKGASEILLAHCSTITTSSGEVDLTEAHRKRIEKTINRYAKQSLRTIALIYKDYPQWPPHGCADENDANSADMDLVMEHMNFLGVVGIQDPVRPGVPEAVAKCQHAGVTVRMVTGDNLVTARAIATECGIYKDDGLVMEGPTFRTLSAEEMKQKLPRLQVLARSSPEDKRILVTKLREMGEIVAVTGDGTNDGPALKAADIGFSMGIAGTEVAKEASAIILMDDNFASILTALMWGRAVNDAVRKFLQFQITVNITAVIITFVSALSNPGGKPVLTAVQLLWINLIMDSLAALALATDPPTEEILDRKPAGRDAPLISVIMWKMIIGQAIFQLIVTFILYFAGPKILGNSILGTDPVSREKMLNSIVFNTFVWMQIFNMYNNRRLDNKFNIFQNVTNNWLFIIINFIMVGCQVMIAFVGGSAFSITRIGGPQWAICLVLSALCLPWAVLVRLFPDSAFLAISKFTGKPVVMIYRPLSRLVSRMGSKKRSKKGKEAEETAASESTLDLPKTDKKSDMDSAV